MRLIALMMFAALGVATPAYATVYDFSVVSTVQNNGSASYIPNYQFSINTKGNHYFNPYSVTFLGIKTIGQRPLLGSPGGDVSYSTNYNFYPMNLDNPEFGGGFDDGGADHSYYGDQLFSGTTANPSFLTGSHNLFYEPGSANVDAVLTIAKVVAPVPEPATWASMLAGLGMAGAVARRRYRKAEDRFTAKVQRLAAA